MKLRWRQMENMGGARHVSSVCKQGFLQGRASGPEQNTGRGNLRSTDVHIYTHVRLHMLRHTQTQAQVCTHTHTRELLIAICSGALALQSTNRNPLRPQSQQAVTDHNHRPTNHRSTKLSGLLTRPICGQPLCTAS